MRVTNRMLVQTVVQNIERNTAALDRVQGQLSSGKRVARPSDDPVAAASGVRLRGERAATDQYRRNIEGAQTWLGATDAALGEMGDALQRIRELAVQASNDTYSAQDRLAAGKEVALLRDSLIASLNSSVGGQHLFAGARTTAPPLSTDGAGNAVYAGDGAAIARDVGPGAPLPVNVTGSVFLPLLGQVQALATALDAGAPGSQVAAGLPDLDAGLDLLLTQRATVGAKLNRLEGAKDRLATADVELGRLQSTNEDVDYAAALTEFASQQAVYRAALEVGARVAPTSLLDFLR